MRRRLFPDYDGVSGNQPIVSAYMKGLLKKTEARHAFTVMKRNHMPGGMLGIDDFYLENGYYADNAGITIEANFQDWALSQMAQQLGYPNSFCITILIIPRLETTFRP